jgi:hypothetical protein
LLVNGFCCSYGLFDGGGPSRAPGTQDGQSNPC